MIKSAERRPLNTLRARRRRRDLRLGLESVLVGGETHVFS